MITPGTWKREPWSAKECQVVTHHNGKRSLICGGVMPDDARLIAAAPSLLEACEEIDKACFKYTGDDQNDYVEAAYAKLIEAIAKARGGDNA